MIRALVVYIGLFLAICPCTYAQDVAEADHVELASKGPLELSGLRVNAEEVGLYEKFEITFDLQGEWDNPFDPEQIRVDAHFRDPDGEELIVPGFFYQEYYQGEDGELEKVGDPVWKVRFTPVKSGTYSYEVTAKNREEELTTAAQTFTSVSYNANSGFLRISKSNPLYFEYDDGTPFFGVAIGEAGGSPEYFATRYKRFARVGGNYNRLFLTGGHLDIAELTPPPHRPDRGLGKMNLESSWNLDRVLELGEELGIYHQLALTNQWTFNNRWEVHTYNKDNGGILEEPAEYWTNEEAKEYLKRRFRYMVARWGYSPSVFSWNLWNEYSAMQGFDLSIAIPWHEEMARYIASIDAFDHVIHTNDGSLNGRDEMHALSEIQLVSTNIYAVKNLAKVAEEWTRRHTRQFQKPYVLTEFGPGHSVGQGGYAGMDPERRMVHDGLWSPIMSGSASTGLAWDSNWLDDEIFYTYAKAVSAFVEGIPFSQREWTPVEVASFEFARPQPTNPTYGDVIVEGWSGNFRIPGNAVEQEHFQIDEEGNVEPQDSLSAVLVGREGSASASWLAAPYGPRPHVVTLEADFPVDGKFVVYVTELRDTEPTPQLTVTLNGEEVLQEDLLPLEVEGYNPRIYNQYYAIDVPEGANTIRVENSGGGSIVTAYELKNYLPREGPDLEIRGLQSEDHILLWLKNQKFTVLHERANVPIEPQPEGLLEVQGVPEGTWIAEWINTVDASSVNTEVVESANQRLALNTPVVEESIVVRLRKIVIE